MNRIPRGFVAVPVFVWYIFSDKGGTVRVIIPSIRELERHLVYLKQTMYPEFRAAGLEDEPEPSMDVRLQCLPTGWRLWDGDPSYDTDHRGYWGAGVITTDTNCRELARDMIAEARDSVALDEVEAECDA